MLRIVAAEEGTADTSGNSAQVPRDGEVYELLPRQSHPRDSFKIGDLNTRMRWPYGRLWRSESILFYPISF